MYRNGFCQAADHKTRQYKRKAKDEVSIFVRPKQLLASNFVICFMKHCFTLILLAFSFGLSAQTGGIKGFSFLNATYSARVAALGGSFITARDQDINVGIQNPALLNKQMTRRASLSQTLFPGGVNNGMLAWGQQLGQKWVGAASFRYMSYGKMTRTDYTGADLGTFNAGDFQLGASAGKAINERMNIGASLNFLLSQLDSYTAFATTIDVGGTYINEDKRFVLSGVVRNLGYQWKTYTGKDRELMPLEIQLGVSEKLKHAPFRFSLLAQHLQTWNLGYTDPNAKPTTDPLTGEIVPPKKDKLIGKVARHALIQTEILLGKALHIRVAYDYNRSRNFALSQKNGIAGFSFGAGVYFKRFSIDYGIIGWSVAGTQHTFTLSLNLQKQ